MLRHLVHYSILLSCMSYSCVQTANKSYPVTHPGPDKLYHLTTHDTVYRRMFILNYDKDSTLISTEKQDCIYFISTDEIEHVYESPKRYGFYFTAIFLIVTITWGIIAFGI